MSGNLISILKCKILIYVIFNTICPLAVTNIDDMVDYIYSLSSMTSLRDSVPEQVIKDILMKNTIDGVLNVPKEYGMFISS